MSDTFLSSLSLSLECRIFTYNVGILSYAVSIYSGIYTGSRVIKLQQVLSYFVRVFTYVRTYVRPPITPSAAAAADVATVPLVRVSVHIYRALKNTSLQCVCISTSSS